jgi:hypothetical protein
MRRPALASKFSSLLLPLFIWRVLALLLLLLLQYNEILGKGSSKTV